MIDINEIERAALANGLNVSDLLTPDEMASLSVEDTSIDHFDNLLSVPEIKDKAAGLASDVIRWLNNDEKGDRAKWVEQEKEALAALGLSDDLKSVYCNKIGTLLRIPYTKNATTEYVLKHLRALLATT